MFTTAATLLLRRDPTRLLHPGVVAAELTVAVALSVSDPIAYAEGHSQSLGSAWPLAGILSAGIAFGGMGGAAAGVVDGWRSTAVRDAAPMFGCGYPGNSATMRR